MIVHQFNNTEVKIIRKYKIDGFREIPIISVYQNNDLIIEFKYERYLDVIFKDEYIYVLYNNNHLCHLVYDKKIKEIERFGYLDGVSFFGENIILFADDHIIIMKINDLINDDFSNVASFFTPYVKDNLIFQDKYIIAPTLYGETIKIDMAAAKLC